MKDHDYHAHSDERSRALWDSIKPAQKARDARAVSVYELNPASYESHLRDKAARCVEIADDYEVD